MKGTCYPGVGKGGFLKFSLKDESREFWADGLKQIRFRDTEPCAQECEHWRRLEMGA